MPPCCASTQQPSRRHLQATRRPQHSRFRAAVPLSCKAGSSRGAACNMEQQAGRQVVSMGLPAPGGFVVRRCAAFVYVCMSVWWCAVGVNIAAARMAVNHLKACHAAGLDPAQTIHLHPCWQPTTCLSNTVFCFLCCLLVHVSPPSPFPPCACLQLNSEKASRHAAAAGAVKGSGLSRRQQQCSQKVGR